MRFFALTWPFSFGVRLGWATNSVPNPPPEQARGRVYFLRGNGIIFSGGFAAIGNRLRKEGLWTEDLRCVGDLWVRKHLTADHAAGRLHGPIILVGHSCGGRYALYTADQMSKLGINIELLICVDVAAPSPVTANVRHAVNLFRSQWRIYPARPLRLAPGSTAELLNLDLDDQRSPIPNAGIHHMNITGSAQLQDWITTRILQAVDNSSPLHSGDDFSPLPSGERGRG